MGKGEQTRQTILAGAAEVAARQGLSALTIGSLATRLDLSKSGLFAHFQSKEALQLAVLAYARDRFVDEVIRPAVREPRGEKRVRALFENWLEIAHHGTAECLFVSASAEFDDQPGAVRDQLVQDHRDFVDTVIQIFNTGVAEGDFAPGSDAAQFMHDLNGIILGFFHAYRLLGERRAADRARRAFELILDSYRTAPTTRGG